jgi:hypothetical protein
MSLFFALIYSCCPIIIHSEHVNFASPDTSVYQLWKDCRLDGIISRDIFTLAVNGSKKADKLKNKSILTIIDYSKPSTEKRFYVVNLENKVLIYQCLVAHGKNSGEANAEHFSNKSGSSESCLGFFRTAETYTGKNGYSLCMDGLEPGINDNARLRSIVIHGADYVGYEYIKKFGRLGRSWGCPALPDKLAKEIIDTIAHGSCVFIYGNDKEYLKNSGFCSKN